MSKSADRIRWAQMSWNDHWTCAIKWKVKAGPFGAFVISPAVWTSEKWSRWLRAQFLGLEASLCRPSQSLGSAISSTAPETALPSNQVGSNGAIHMQHWHIAATTTTINTVENTNSLTHHHNQTKIENFVSDFDRTTSNAEKMAETTKRTTNSSATKSRKSRNDIIRTALGMYLKQKNYSVSNGIALKLPPELCFVWK